MTTLIELAIGLLFMFQTFYAIFMGYLGWIPFLLIIQLGFLYTSILSIFHGWRRLPVTINPLEFGPKPALTKENNL